MLKGQAQAVMESGRRTDAPRAEGAAFWPMPRGHLLVLAALSAVLLAGLLVFSPGTVIVDEAFYALAARRFAEAQSFIIDNGWARYHSDNLRVWLLMKGPHGLTPQYPAGQAVLSAPFFALLGYRGLFLMNVLAACGTLFATYALAMRFAGDRTAALVAVALLVLGSFWLEYAYAISPHSIAALCVLLAVIAAISALDVDRGAAKNCAAAGAVIGLGMFFRTDTILVLPALGLLLLIYADRPIRANLWLVAGLIPLMLAISAMNYLKFGTFNPLSYGRSDNGGTSLSYHWPAILALVTGGLAATSMRLSGWRPTRRIVILGLAIGLVAVVLVEPLRNLTSRYLFGAWALGVDATLLEGSRYGINAKANDVVSFWGYWKKALAQSMPWLGLIGLAAWMPADARFRRAQIVTLIVVLCWTLPFVITSWEGGFGSNMRYFLPLLPLLCALVGKRLCDLCRQQRNWQRILGLGSLTGVVLLAGWTVLHPSGVPGVQQILSTWLFLAILLVAMLGGLAWRGQSLLQTVCLALFGAGLVASACNLGLDFAKSQRQRAKDWRAQQSTISLPDRALVYAADPHIISWGFHPDRLVARPIRTTPTFDPELIAAAQADGLKVLAHAEFDIEQLRSRYGNRVVSSNYPDGEGGRYIEILPPQDE